jgi:peptide-methionine (S)-S-oxide reductase
LRDSWFDPRYNVGESQSREDVATFAGGCFWCLQPLFQDLKGVRGVIVGYAGGHVKDPSYEEVCTDTTGHAEAVQVTFDPSQITYEDLLHVFFTVHNPTTRNRQGADVGTQYRSVVFYATPAQKAAAEKVVREFDAQKLWDFPIVTEVVPLPAFYQAEEYHQDYYRKNPYAGYCLAVIRPKVSKFRKRYADSLKA